MLITKKLTLCKDYILYYYINNTRWMCFLHNRQQVYHSKSENPPGHGRYVSKVCFTPWDTDCNNYN